MMQANPFYLQRLIIQIKAGSGIPTERTQSEYRLITVYHLAGHFHFRDGRVERGRIGTPKLGIWDRELMIDRCLPHTGVVTGRIRYP